MTRFSADITHLLEVYVITFQVSEIVWKQFETYCQQDKWNNIFTDDLYDEENNVIFDSWAILLFKFVVSSVTNLQDMNASSE